jgi:membrane-bound metal-dependent hydrolase YbcI (DUF457 family)
VTIRHHLLIAAMPVAITAHWWSPSFMFGAVAVLLAALAAWLPDRDARGLTKQVLHHRGPLHTPLVALVLSAILLLLVQIPPVLALVFFWGYISHLMADGLTMSGVPFLYPFSRRHHHLVPHNYLVVTGSPEEVGYVAAWYWLWLYVLIYLVAR